MGRIPALSPQDIIKLLKKKGFVLDRTKGGTPTGGSHHIYYHPQLKKRVVIPLHKKDLPRGLSLEILKQAGIGKDRLKDLLWGTGFLTLMLFD